MPKVSIIITIYNQEEYVAKAIHSVLVQTYPNFELIIWDDGSTDKSLEIAKSFNDNRIRLFAKDHLGHATALQMANKEAKGEYIGWVDSDDILEPDALSETASMLDQHSEVGMVYTDYLIIDEDDRPRGYGKRSRIPYSKERLLLNFMTFHFRLFRKSIYEQAGGVDVTFQLAEDYDLCLKISEITQIKHIKKALYHYRKHSNNSSKLYRVDQIFEAQQAIAKALKRRGMDGQFDVDLEIRGIYSLRRKKFEQTASQNG